MRDRIRVQDGEIRVLRWQLSEAVRGAAVLEVENRRLRGMLNRSAEGGLVLEGAMDVAKDGPGGGVRADGCRCLIEFKGSAWRSRKVRTGLPMGCGCLGSQVHISRS
jgi:hypothetical protein